MIILSHPYIVSILSILFYDVTKLDFWNEKSEFSLITQSSAQSFSRKYQTMSSLQTHQATAQPVSLF